MAGADLRAALVASCFLGAFPPVDFLAVCFVRAIFDNYFNCEGACSTAMKTCQAFRSVGVNIKSGDFFPFSFFDKVFSF